jgi:hypothetical protein
MATEKQIEANRRNAQKSTGPRSEEGKSKSRVNGYKHGLTGHLDVLSDADRQARDAFMAGIMDRFKPADALEHQLAHSIADGYWRINRVSAMESSLLAADTDESPLASMNLLTVYEMRLHRKVKSDLQQLREIQAARRADEAMIAEQELAANRRVFDEACVLLELNMRQDDQLDLDGKFTHPNGFVYPVPKLLGAMAANRRMQRARQNVATNPFTAAELEPFLPDGTRGASRVSEC